MEERIKFKNDLNTRQWDLYEYLSNKKNFVNIKQIIGDLSQHYLLEDDLGRESNNGVGVRKLKRDIRVLRESKILHKIIIHSKWGYKIASKEEFEEWYTKRMNSLKKSMSVLNGLKKKAENDLQTRIVFNTETDTIRSFPESEVEENAK